MPTKLILTKGSSLSYDCTVTSVPSGRTISAAVMMIKGSTGDADEDALLTKSISASPNADGQILDTGADGTGLLRFVIESDDLDALEVGTLYISGVSVELDNGFQFDVDELSSPVRVRQAVVRDV